MMKFDVYITLIALNHAQVFSESHCDKFNARKIIDLYWRHYILYWAATEELKIH